MPMNESGADKSNDQRTFHVKTLISYVYNIMTFRKPSQERNGDRVQTGVTLETSADLYYLLVLHERLLKSGDSNLIVTCNSRWIVQ